jgi:hypothetical protein
MFVAETSPIATFQGFKVKCFRQGRTNLAERRLTRTQVLFAPTRGVVGVFLHQATTVLETRLLEAAWRAQGCPQVTLPDANYLVLWGQLVPVQKIPFAGCEDIWLQEGTLHITFRRQIDVTRMNARLDCFLRQQLLETALSALERFKPLLTKLPQRIEVCPLRPRILGQCTREGVIRLNASLSTWPESVMEETLAHELVHLEHFNHASAFWRRLTALLPDWLPRSLAHYLA